MKIVRKLRYFTSFSKQGKLFVPHGIIFKIVSQTQNYKDFIPWCSSSRVIEKKSETQNRTQLGISFKNFDQKYVSNVKIDASNDRYLIHSVCKDSPLQYLDSKWFICKSIQRKSTQSVQYETLVRYNLDFQFDSFTYKMVSGVFLDYLGTQMWNIFTKKAENCYRNQLIHGDLNAYFKKNHEHFQIYNQNERVRSNIDKIWEKYALKVDQSTQKKLSQQIVQLFRKQHKM